MNFFECKVEYFDEDCENNTAVWTGYVCEESYAAAAKKLYDNFFDTIISMSLYATEDEELLDHCATTYNSFYWKDKEENKNAL